MQRTAVLSIAWVAGLMPSPAVAQNAPQLRNVPGTVALYQFDEGTGATVRDSSGNNRHGSLTGAVTWRPGFLSASALHFDAAGEYVTFSTPIPLRTEWTIQAWTEFPLATGGDGYRTLILGGGQAHIIVYNGRLGTYPWGYTDFNVSGLGGWHLLTAVGSGGKTRFYVDGAQVGTVDAQATAAVDKIGNWPGFAEYWGIVDSVRILDGARSGADIATDAAPTYPPPPAPSALVQADWTGAAIPAAGTAHGLILVRATVGSSSGGPATAEVEIKPAGAAFDGTSGLFTGDPVPSGAVATVKVPGLSTGSWHWRIRSRDESWAVASAWVVHGSNPSAPDFTLVNSDPIAQSPGQRDGADGSTIPVTRRAYDSDGVWFEAWADDPDLDPLVLLIEVRPVGTPFSNEATHWSEAGPGGRMLACLGVFPTGAYHWQYCVVDAMGASSPWISFNAAATSADFIVIPGGSQGNAKCGGSAGTGGLGLALLLSFWLSRTPRFLSRG